MKKTFKYSILMHCPMPTTALTNNFESAISLALEFNRKTDQRCDVYYEDELIMLAVAR